MNAEKIKYLLNREVISQIKNYSIKPIIQEIAFNPNNNIDWDNVYKIIMEFMPELKRYAGYLEENMK